MLNRSITHDAANTRALKSSLDEPHHRRKFEREASSQKKFEKLQVASKDSSCLPRGSRHWNLFQTFFKRC